MGPGRYYTHQPGIGQYLTLEEIGHLLVGAGIGVVTRLAALPTLLHWNYHIFKEQTNWLDFTSPGGGGPEAYPISTTTPPSIEEVGRIITGLSDMGHGEPGVGRRSTNGKRPRCPPGKRWSRRLRRCVDRKMFPPGFITIPYIDR